MKKYLLLLIILSVIVSAGAGFSVDRLKEVINTGVVTQDDIDTANSDEYVNAITEGYDMFKVSFGDMHFYIDVENDLIKNVTNTSSSEPDFEIYVDKDQFLIDIENYQSYSTMEKLKILNDFRKQLPFKVRMRIYKLIIF